MQEVVVVMTIRVEEIGEMEIIMVDLEMVVEGMEIRMSNMGVETRETREVQTR